MLVSAVMIVAIRRASKVRVFDRLMFGWLSFAVLFLVLFNFTRPANLLTTAFDIIVPFAIYVLSPLKLSSTVALTAGFTLGTLYVDYFFKVGVDPIALSMASSAQFLVHALGLVIGPANSNLSSTILPGLYQ